MQKKTTVILLGFTFLGMAFSGSRLVKTNSGSDDIFPFIYGDIASPPGFDPLAVYDSISGNIIVNHLEGLFTYDYSDPNLGIIPQLAADMGSWNAAGNEWTIPLRDDVTWQDGSQFSASDVKWNWDRLNYLAGENICAHSSLWYNDEGDLMLARTKVIDDHTIQFTLAKPWKDFEYLQSFWGCALIKPVEYKSEHLIGQEELDLIIGTGPFVLDNYIAGGKTEFVANNDYYIGAPDIQKLIFLVFPDTIAANEALMAQEIHCIRNVLPENRRTFNMDVTLSYCLQEMAVCFFYHLNVHNIDWAVRKAMQFAYDYKYLIEVTMDGNYFEHHSPVPDGMIGYNKDLPELPYYDLEKAREYLINDPFYGPLVAARVANISNDQDWIDCALNTPLAAHNFTHWGSGYDYQFIDNMEYIGIRIVNNIVGDWGTYLMSNRENLEIVIGGWSPDYWHPINQIEPIYKTNASYNYNGLDNASIDALMGDAHTLTGTDLEWKIDEIVNAIVVEQAATMYFMQRQEAIGWSSAFVSNLNDLFNPVGEKYFYKVEFELSHPPLFRSYMGVSWLDIRSILIFIGILGVVVIGFLASNHYKKKQIFHTTHYEEKYNPSIPQKREIQRSPTQQPTIEVKFRYCITCGSRNESKSRFCGNCGHPME
jgi:peptide/nickel transport system substrate-binding protein